MVGFGSKLATVRKDSGILNLNHRDSEIKPVTPSLMSVKIIALFLPYFDLFYFREPHCFVKRIDFSH